jgi:hypothetical protein
MKKKVITSVSLSVVLSGVTVAAENGEPPIDPYTGIVEKSVSGLSPMEGGTTGDREAIWLIDDFEAGFAAGWTDPPGGGTASIDTIGAAFTNHSLRIDGGDGGYDMWFNLGAIQPTGFGLYIRSGSSSLSDTYVVLGDDTTTLDNGAVFFAAFANGHLALATNTGVFSCGNYTENTWYYVNFALDWSCKAVDVYVDGVLRQYNVPFRNTDVDFLSQLHVFNFASSTAWWDQISASTPPPGMGIFADGFERESTCRWSMTVN